MNFLIIFLLIANSLIDLWGISWIPDKLQTIFITRILRVQAHVP